MTDITLRVHEDGSDDDRVEQLTGFLRDELRQLAETRNAPGEAPAPGAKSVELAALGTLLVTLSQSTVLAALITAVSTWLGNKRERSVTVEVDGDPLELHGAPTAEERKRTDEWVKRRTARRYALIIASYEFADPSLRELRAPAHDAARLGEVLQNARIGGFEVRTLINPQAAEVNEAVEDFFADREPDDLLVLHFSGHGVKDEAGELHFATAGTKLNRLAGTAVSADFVARRMNRSRSRRVVLLLDCCYSGAFGRGMVARAGGNVGLEEQFGGSGRAVITASSAMEYAFEGSAIADTSEGEPSVFTSALVEGLESGDADRDLDGFVGLDELYDYVYDRVRRVTPHQTPGKWMLDVRGDLRIARRARPVKTPAALPSELQEAIDHSLPGVRAGAVPELRRLLSVRHEGRALAARLALRRLAEDDSRMVAAAAREALGEPEPPSAPAPTSLMATPKPPPKAETKPEPKPAPKPEAKPEAKVTVQPLVASGSGRTPPAMPVRVPTLVTWYSRVVAGLALVALTLGVTTAPAGRVFRVDTSSLEAVFFSLVWLWALVAVLFVLAVRDHDWLPGVALGLTAGVTGLVMGESPINWPLLVGLALTVLVLARLDWVAAAAAVLGAGVLVIVAVGGQSIFGHDSDEEEWQMTFSAVALLITGLAVYRHVRQKVWQDALTPVLLLAAGAWAVFGTPYPYSMVFLPVLVVVPLVEALTTGNAKFAARLLIAATLLLRMPAYDESTPVITYGLTALALAAAATAYFSRSR